MLRNLFGSILPKFYCNPSYVKFTSRFNSNKTGCGDKPPEDPCKGQMETGLVLGIYTNPDDIHDPGYLTPSGHRYNAYVCGRLTELLRYAGPPPKLGDYRVFYNLSEEFSSVAITGLGERCQGYNMFEKIDEGKEAIRVASAIGCRALQHLRVEKIFVESFGHSESSAEGSALSIWLYQSKKDKSKQLRIPKLELYDDCDWTGWQIGLQKAAAQNLARKLMDSPANIITPKLFAQTAVEVLCNSGVNVEVKVKPWCENQKMHAFLAAAQASCEPPIFLELSYYGSASDERPIVLVGTGITYDSGGIILKPQFKQIWSRGHVAGAACTVAACRAAAALQLPINIRALIPLCEYMPGCSALRPGDIVRTVNGKNIYIQTCDVAARLATADALAYSKNFWPRLIVDLGTSSADMKYALGTAACGVFSNSEILWEYMSAAAMHSGDRVWRFPLWDHYTKLVQRTRIADVKSFGDGILKRNGESCRVAAILREFVPCGDWLHMDLFGTIYTDGTELPYLRKGMTGRPTRTIIEFLSQLICNREQC